MPNNEEFTLPEDLRDLIREGLDNKLPPEEYERRKLEIAGQIRKLTAELPRVSVPLATAAEDPYAATSWGQPSEQDFTCPSGQKCRVRRVDIMDLLGGGILNDLDFLTSMVNETHIPNAGPGKSNAALQGIVGDTKNLAKFQRTMTDVVLRVVIRPELHPVPAEGEPRIDGRVYIDSVQMTDKIALFNWAVTGKEAEEIKQFREQAGEPVGDVATRESVSTETVELPGDPTTS
jgi:hypothetical protein